MAADELWHVKLFLGLKLVDFLKLVIYETTAVIAGAGLFVDLLDLITGLIQLHLV